MAYTINKYSGIQLIVLEDGTVDTSTSIGLVGRNYVGYGEIQNENFLYLLENFANTNPPARPLEGQLWFNTTNDLLHVYDGSKWVIVGSAVISETPPPSPPNGALWYKMPYRTLHVYESGDWRFIGPETSDGFATTRARSSVLFDSDSNPKPVILIEINGSIIGIITSQSFTLNPTTAPTGFGTLAAGINLIFGIDLKGNVQGKATRADRLETARNINGIPFDGTTDVTIKSNTTNSLIRGGYLTGPNFDGSVQSTWAVDASPNNLIGKVVARDSAGNFSAGTITANLIGNIQGNVTATSGTSSFDIVSANRFVGATLTGNAATSSRLETARLINGISFDGGSNITVPAAGETLTGVSLATNIKHSYLENLGTLSSLNVAADGITVGSKLKIIATGTPTVRNQSNGSSIIIDTADSTRSGGYASVSLISSAVSLSGSGDNKPALIPATGNDSNLGHPSFKWNKVYANELKGNADTATLAVRSTNIVGGSLGSIPYQSSANTTTMLPLGAAGTYLRASAGGLTWATLAFEGLVAGSYLIGSNYNTASQTTWSVDATPNNTANKVVARDSSGNFSAGTITANLSGNVTGNLNGNAATVTNGVYTSQSYSNPSWITALAGSKVTSIPNSSLQNSSITINGSSVSLGSSVNLALGFGGGQTWQNLAGSRTYGRNYTNDTGKTIYVSMMFYTPDNDSDDPYQYAIAYVDGVEVDRALWTRSNPAGAPVWLSLKFFVAAGSSYRCDMISPDEGTNVPSYGLSIARWSEFR